MPQKRLWSYMKIKNAKVLITGASRGIGLALAEGLARKGASLYLVARKLPAKLEKDLKQLGAHSVELLNFDLSERGATESIFALVAKKNIEIDILINNAGLLTGGLLEKQDRAAIRAMLDVNLTALIELSHLFLPGMLERKRGLIVNNSSVSGKMFFPCASTYAASKAGVVAFTESLYQELRGTGVSTLLAITPGVKTKMFDEIPKLYGENLKLDFLSSITAESWAQHLIQAIERDARYCLPKGPTRANLWISAHFPKVFESLVGSRFRRSEL
jgi:short-subunit dehydrogenase